MSAYELAMLWAGLFLLTGMLTGVWKYQCMRRSTEAVAPYYVNIAHRTSLLYSFACAVLALLARGSAWPAWLNRVGVWLSVIFFALAVVSYIVHGLLRDTDNQFRSPHVLGRARVPKAVLEAAMLALIAAEIGGLLILLSGFWWGVGG